MHLGSERCRNHCFSLLFLVTPNCCCAAKNDQQKTHPTEMNRLTPIVERSDCPRPKRRRRRPIGRGTRPTRFQRLGYLCQAASSSEITTCPIVHSSIRPRCEPCQSSVAAGPLPPLPRGPGALVTGRAAFRYNAPLHQ